MADFTQFTCNVKWMHDKTKVDVVTNVPRFDINLIDEWNVFVEMTKISLEMPASLGFAEYLKDKFADLTTQGIQCFYYMYPDK